MWQMKEKLRLLRPTETVEDKTIVIKQDANEYTVVSFEDGVMSLERKKKGYM